MCVCVAGKNTDTVLQQLEGFFLLVGSQFVDACFEQEIAVVRPELQSLFIGGRRLGEAERPVELGHQGRLGETTRILRTNRSNSGKQRRQKQDCTETICGCADGHTTGA